MSKAQKGNKENKKPKADKNQSKANVSAYKAAAQLFLIQAMPTLLGQMLGHNADIVENESYIK